MAKLLTSMARSTDAIGRLGGDEFVIVCDGLTRPHTANLVARLGDAFDSGLGVRISVGVAGSGAGGSAKPISSPEPTAPCTTDKRRLRHNQGGDGPADPLSPAMGCCRHGHADPHRRHAAADRRRVVLPGHSVRSTGTG